MYRFSEMQTAINFASRCEKMMMVIMGDDNMYWVVTMSKGEKLISQGYEAV